MTIQLINPISKIGETLDPDEIHLDKYFEIEMNCSLEEFQILQSFYLNSFESGKQLWYFANKVGAKRFGEIYYA